MNRGLATILGVLLASSARVAAAPPLCLVVTPEVTALGPICLDNGLYDAIAIALDADADLRRARWSCTLATGDVLLEPVRRLPDGEAVVTVPPPDVCVLLEPFLETVSLPGACLLALEVEDHAGEVGRCVGASVTYDRTLQE